MLPRYHATSTDLDSSVRYTLNGQHILDLSRHRRCVITEWYMGGLSRCVAAETRSVGRLTGTERPGLEALVPWRRIRGGRFKDSLLGTAST